MLVTIEMKCPKCGSDNQIGAKFCSECANKLPDAAPVVQNTAVPLDERISNELVELWKLYEIDEFEVALEKIGNIKKNLSGSSSIYSMAALVYEKRAKAEYDRGDIAAYYDDLGNAAKEYEEVVKQNPNSAADRAKLLALKHKLLASADIVLGTEPPLLAFLKKIPLPAWAAIAVFVVILIGAAIASNMSRHQASEQAVYPAQVNTQYVTPPSQSMYSPQTQASNQNRSVGGVYTFPMAKLNQAPATAPYTQNQQTDAGRQRSYDTGYDRILPPIDPVKVEITPSANTKPKVSSTKPNAPQISLSTGTNGRNNSGAFEQSNQDQNDNDSDDPDTWLANAFEYEKQGQDGLALAAAERAHKLFQRNAADGRNVEASENGIELAKGLMRKLENKKR